MAWIDGWPPPSEVFGDFARWLPLTIFLGGLAIGLPLLFGVPFDEDTGRWLFGIAAVPAWILRIATLKRDTLRAHRRGPAIAMLAWWIAGLGVVGAMWAPSGSVGVGLTILVALLFLFLAHGRYALAVDDRSPPDTGGAS